MIRIVIQQDEGESTHDVVVEDRAVADGGASVFIKGVTLQPHAKQVFYVEEGRHLTIRQKEHHG